MILVSVLFVAGCASPGPPRPPSLHLPQIVSGLTVERIGNEVLLHWNTPDKTTDGLNLETPLTAQLCRRMIVTITPTGSEKNCSPVRRVTATPGTTEVVDSLPLALTQGPIAILEYRIELLNRNGRSAGLSAPAFAAAGAAPPLVTGLRAETTPTGTLLRWTPTDEADQVELERLRVEAVPNQTVKEVVKEPTTPFRPSEKQPAKVHLLVTEAATGNPPALPATGGTLDRTAERGEAYTYTAQRVRRVTVAGQPFQLRSAASSPVTIVMRDTFPPGPPMRVEAIAASSGIDLSWSPNAEADLAGYLVYRTEVTQSLRGTPAAIVTPALVLAPAFRDTTVQSGHTYVYTVVAVDKEGNRSLPSEPAREEVPLP